jgi:hypothetical protein
VLLEGAAGGARRKKRLIRDPKTGKLIAQPRRKHTRTRPEWEEDIGRWTEDDLEDAMGFTEDDFIAKQSDDDEEEEG